MVWVYLGSSGLQLRPVKRISRLTPPRPINLSAQPWHHQNLLSLQCNRAPLSLWLRLDQRSPCLRHGLTSLSLHSISPPLGLRLPSGSASALGPHSSATQLCIGVAGLAGSSSAPRAPLPSVTSPSVVPQCHQPNLYHASSLARPCFQVLALLLLLLSLPPSSPSMSCPLPATRSCINSSLQQPFVTQPAQEKKKKKITECMFNLRHNFYP